MFVRVIAFVPRLAVAVVLLGCAGRKHSDERASVAAVPITPIVLEVENHNWADVVLYVLHDGQRTRLTQVSAARDLSIEIPPQLQGEMGIIRFALRRIGGKDSFVTESISLRGGSAVRLTIESNINRSTVGVW